MPQVVCLFIILFGLVRPASIGEIPFYQKICSPLGSGLKVLTPADFGGPQLGDPLEPMDLELDSLFNEGKELGVGSFGTVKLASVSLPDFPRLVIKKVEAVQSTSTEIVVQKAMAGFFLAPDVLGCQYGPAEPWPPAIYIASEGMTWDLENQEARQILQAQPKHFRINFYKKMLELSDHLWGLGFLHNDLKPANYMTNKSVDRVWLIDFGGVTRVKSHLPDRGSPPFISPGRFTGEPVHQKHEIYSWALTVAYLEAPVTTLQKSSLFKRPSPSFFQKWIDPTLPSSCFDSVRTLDCKADLLKNVVSILTQNGMGPFIETTAETSGPSPPSLCNLIYEIVEYDNFVGDFKSVIRKLVELTTIEHIKYEAGLEPVGKIETPSKVVV